MDVAVLDCMGMTVKRHRGQKVRRLHVHVCIYSYERQKAVKRRLFVRSFGGYRSNYSKHAIIRPSRLARERESSYQQNKVFWTNQQSSSERKRRLSPLRIAHLVDTNIITKLHIVHALRRDQNELSPHRPPSNLDQHAHAGGAVDRVHEDVELVETADRAAHGLPDGEQQADGGEGLFAAGQSLGPAAGIGLFGQVGLDFDVELLALVVHDDAAAELPLAEQIAELEARAEGYVLAEHLPAVVALVEGSLDCLRLC